MSSRNQYYSRSGVSKRDLAMWFEDEGSMRKLIDE